jgi:hypothetical protein
MTKEELVNEAEKSLDKRLGTYAYIRKQDCYTNYVDGYIDSAEPREKRIAELEKENAELKADNEAKDIQIKELQEQKCYWKESSFDWRHKFFKKDEVKRLVKKDKQLTKAKNLLQKVADVCGYPNYDIPVELYADIADFLKDSEVEK